MPGNRLSVYLNAFGNLKAEKLAYKVYNYQISFRGTNLFTGYNSISETAIAIWTVSSSDYQEVHYRYCMPYGGGGFNGG